MSRLLDEAQAYERVWFRIICGHHPPTLEALHSAQTRRRRDEKTKRAADLLALKEAGMSIAEIAEREGWSLSWARTMLQVARERRSREAARKQFGIVLRER